MNKYFFKLIIYDILKFVLQWCIQKQYGLQFSIEQLGEQTLKIVIYNILNLNKKIFENW